MSLVVVISTKDTAIKQNRGGTPLPCLSSSESFRLSG